MAFRSDYAKFHKELRRLLDLGRGLSERLALGVTPPEEELQAFAQQYVDARSRSDYRQIYAATDRFNDKLRELNSLLATLATTGNLHKSVFCNCEDCCKARAEETRPPSNASFASRHSLPPAPTEISSAAMVAFMNALHNWAHTALLDLFDNLVPAAERKSSPCGSRYSLSGVKDLRFVVAKLTEYERERDAWQQWLAKAETIWDDFDSACYRLQTITAVRDLREQLFNLPEESPLASLLLGSSLLGGLFGKL